MPIRNANVMPTLAVTNLDDAKRFYGDTLGLEEVHSYMPDGSDVLYRVGENAYLYVYERSTPSGSTATACAIAVEDVESVAQELRDKGLQLEEYDIPEMGLKTENGIAEMGGLKTAWVTDPSGNMVAIDDSLKVLREQTQAA